MQNENEHLHFDELAEVLEGAQLRRSADFGEVVKGVLSRATRGRNGPHCTAHKMASGIKAKPGDTTYPEHIHRLETESPAGTPTTCCARTHWQENLPS